MLIAIRTSLLLNIQETFFFISLGKKRKGKYIIETETQFKLRWPDSGMVLTDKECAIFISNKRKRPLKISTQRNMVWER